MKAKYLIYQFNQLRRVYVTTNRSEENMVEELRKIVDGEGIKIIKDEGMESKCVYRYEKPKIEKKPKPVKELKVIEKPVIDIKSGYRYRSIAALSRKLSLSQWQASLLVRSGRSNYRFESELKTA